jgi:hypothetical protein
LTELQAGGVEPIPSSLGGYPVDITNAEPEELLRQAFPELTTQLDALEVAHGYVPPTDIPLDRVKERMQARFHVSPDHGWDELSKFFADTKPKGRLDCAMYDFTAPHIRVAIEKALGAEGKMRLTLDFKPASGLTGTKSADEVEAQVVADLKQKLGSRFEVVDAGVGVLFPSAYHIKVTVRDGIAFWLSSGNWQSSNQPTGTDPAGKQLTPKDLLTNYDRDWHAIIQNGTLADNFRRYLDYDFANGLKFGKQTQAALPELFIPDGGLWLQEAGRVVKFFDTIAIDDVLDIQPLLTPDNYSDHVLAMIESAQRSVYFINQSLNIGATPPAAYTALLDALLAKQRKGLDVKIIIRDLGARVALESMKTYGFDTNQVKVRPGCHTKGIVVDSNVVLIGSQNWTGQGVTTNRDASLIVLDSRVAQYYENIFLYDWQNWSRQFVSAAAPGGEMYLLSPGQPIPDPLKSYRSVPLAEILEL